MICKHFAMDALATAKAETAIAAAMDQGILITILHHRNDHISSRETIWANSFRMTVSLERLCLLLRINLIYKGGHKMKFIVYPTDTTVISACYCGCNGVNCTCYGGSTYTPTK